MDRREVLKVGAAGGAALTGVSVAAGELAQVRNPAWDAAANWARFNQSRARVAWCRSFESGIYLTINDQVRGWYLVKPHETQLYAIAAAAQAANREVFIRYAGYDSQWGNGAGLFSSVQLAFNEF